MTQSLDALWEQVRAQKTRIPSLYGDIDFDVTPERFTDDIHTRGAPLRKQWAGQQVSGPVWSYCRATPR